MVDGKYFLKIILENVMVCLTKETETDHNKHLGGIKLKILRS